MAVKVTVPNKHYNAVFMDVEFKNGEALVEDKKIALEMVERFGYSMEELEAEKPKKAPAKKAPAKKSTKKVEE